MPGLCPAVGFRRHVFLWAQKLLVNSFRNFNMTFPATWGCASDFLKMLPKLKMAARGQLQNILGAQKLSQKLFKFYYHFPTIWRCAGDFFKVLLKFKMVATDQLQFFSGRKNSKNYFGQFFFNFNITFLPKCGCASDFLKMIPKFKMAARSQHQNFLWVQ